MRMIEHKIWYGDEEKAKILVSLLVDLADASAQYVDNVGINEATVEGAKLINRLDTLLESI